MMKASSSLKHDTKWIFFKQGTCSRTLFYILNREFGHPMEQEEKAIDPLAGGILQQGYQCGQLWGSSMAVGAEAYRRAKDPARTTALAIRASRRIVDSFKERAKTAACSEITEADFSSKASMAKYMLSGKFLGCYILADKWAPEAIKAAREGLDAATEALPDQAISCASEVLRRMGSTEQQAAMVAGFAGGIGLSGDACGALGAAIWLRTMRWQGNNPGKSGYNNPEASTTLETFLKASDYELECSKICGREFSSIEEHSEYIRCGGCEKIIAAIASTEGQ